MEKKLKSANIIFDRIFSVNDNCPDNYVHFKVNNIVVEGEWRKKSKERD